MSEFENEIVNWLNEDLLIESEEKSKHFPENDFLILLFPEKLIALHLIDIQRFENIQQDNKLSFQELSAHYQALGYKMIHLWEDVWKNRKELVKSRLEVSFGKFRKINARHCYVKRIDKLHSEMFLQENHLQGSVKSKFKYGLFLKKQYVAKYVPEASGEDDLLVAAATFSSGRTMKWGERKDTRSYELLRFAGLKGFVVIGGFDKLLKAFAEEQKPDDVMTYADRDWSDGRSYEMLGFEKTDMLSPQCYLLDKNTFQRISSTDHIAENEHDLLKVWNAGSIKYWKVFRHE